MEGVGVGLSGRGWGGFEWKGLGLDFSARGLGCICVYGEGGRLDSDSHIVVKDCVHCISMSMRG